MKTITANALTTLNEVGKFRVPVSRDQTKEIADLLEMREHCGFPRPFHGEIGADAILEGFLYLWVKPKVTVLYIAQKFKPNIIEQNHGKFPRLLIKSLPVSLSRKDEILRKVAQILGQGSPQKSEGGFPSSFSFCLRFLKNLLKKPQKLLIGAPRSKGNLLYFSAF